jgi:hypothetical protein
MEMPKEELVSTSAEAQRASGELDNTRSGALKESAQESLVRERELRETQTELEQCRTEKYEWEQTALQERVLAAEARSNAELYRRALELEWETRKRDAPELESEWEISDRLQFVLQDFETCELRFLLFFRLILTCPREGSQAAAGSQPAARSGYPVADR